MKLAGVGAWYCTAWPTEKPLPATLIVLLEMSLGLKWYGSRR